MSAAPPRRRRTALALTTTATALALLVSGCGFGAPEGKRIRVGVSGDSPEWEVLAKEAKKEGLTVETVVFDDYSLPNKALSAGDIELNAFQHLVFLAQSNTENKTDIAPVAATTVVPLGLYSGKHKQLADLPDGASVTLPNDPANQGRGLRVLEQAKVIELKKDAGLFATPDDITANPKHIKITPVNAQQTPRTLKDADAAIINDGVAELAGIDAKTALFKDDPASPQSVPYLNVIAARADRKDDPDYAKIVKLYASQAVQDEVRRTSNGTAHHIDLPAPELQAELARITKQLAK
ncbi:MetQ/NlpA family ABC transporter substrate-binding protein [Streptomyces lavendulae]|uniref:MetQ/NlpA family ABC transporter substrate-binding protein n=1 Tax=Streptomyces lavendulae TaxID=1914 RepID=UPI0024A3EDBC|nr:MetQ/NlpA family ABC transporter substrate-binding protein [Streptomyces lavendulae]GLX17017.1 lipoprotein [Streptomyces lavendulae subsp. lavendulae]GLX29524.1 lipoprotein [Streptomyces lavendulae subsp. lavendulae]